MVNYKRELNLSCLPLRKKYRSRLEILALMLEAVKVNGTAPYSLMKHTSINFVQLKRYLEYLTEMGFIERDVKEGRVLYRASEQGLDFLGQYYVLRGMLSSSARQFSIAEALKIRGFWCLIFILFAMTRWYQRSFCSGSLSPCAVKGFSAFYGMCWAAKPAGVLSW